MFSKLWEIIKHSKPKRLEELVFCIVQSLIDKRFAKNKATIENEFQIVSKFFARKISTGSDLAAKRNGTERVSA